MTNSKINKFNIIFIIYNIFKSNIFLKVLLVISTMNGMYDITNNRFILLIIVALISHELANFYAFKKHKIENYGSYFIPLIGSYNVFQKVPDYQKVCYLAVASPIASLFLSIIPFYLLYLIEHNVNYLLAIYVVALFNLFNLLPIHPLDGGKLIKSIAFSIDNKFGLTIYILSFLLVATLIYQYHFYLLSIIFILGLMELYEEYSLNKKYKEIKKMDWFDKTFFWIVYIALIGIYTSILYLTKDYSYLTDYFLESFNNIY